MIDRNMIVRK